VGREIAVSSGPFADGAAGPVEVGRTGPAFLVSVGGALKAGEVALSIDVAACYWTRWQPDLPTGAVANGGLGAALLFGIGILPEHEVAVNFQRTSTSRPRVLRPDLFPASDLGTIRVDLSSAGAEVVQLRLKTGSSRRKAPAKGPEEQENGQSRPVSREPPTVSTPDRDE
jgi:hypothetical protein